jgi:hypothetical protein
MRLCSPNNIGLGSTMTAAPARSLVIVENALSKSLGPR